MERKAIPVVFTPDNEPYIGRFMLTDHQNMACQVIAQAISIALSISELIRRGYLFRRTCSSSRLGGARGYPPLP
jgi:hypothetical protein